MIRLTTNLGEIDIELDFNRAPVTAKNFEDYVKEGFYNGVIFPVSYTHLTLPTTERV